MKKLSLNHLLLLCFLFLFSSFTSKNSSICYWVGGTIGFETEWNNPKNWSTNKVPDWTYDCVVIPNTSTSSNHFPIIKSSTEPIPHLHIHSGASLEVSYNGQLIIDGNTTYNYGIMNGGEILNKGYISVHSTALLNLLDLNGIILNEGVFDLEDNIKAHKY